MGFLRDAAWRAIHGVPEGFWHAFTWLGDSGLLLPAAALIALWLLSSRRTWPAAALWILIFGFASLLVLLSKLAFMGWGIGSARLNFTGISGHTMLTAAVWPVALWLLASRGSHRLRVGLALAGWLLALGIGVSRLAIYAHSWSEVTTGFLLGFVTSAAFLALQRRVAHPQLRASLVLVTLLLPLVHQQPGNAAPTHGLLERVAMRLAGTDRPFTRADLHVQRG
ncbi:phosphatase PAP2 family protein [Variovorax sp. OV329]|uniref:phosphatase PAP2 family protein n=1 Tax=Variovorax sp. OV329 TaxID=1882825 RepID=UPI0008E8368A|nr:phosphatase PAP2 family protein [Variovorax sp. OV329]SFM99106.1 PAP2 superfamily protein [Variovorax sp. OV329]